MKPILSKNNLTYFLSLTLSLFSLNSSALHYSDGQEREREQTRRILERYEQYVRDKEHERLERAIDEQKQKLAQQQPVHLQQNYSQKYQSPNAQQGDYGLPYARHSHESNLYGYEQQEQINLVQPIVVDHPYQTIMPTYPITFSHQLTELPSEMPSQPIPYFTNNSVVKKKNSFPCAHPGCTKTYTTQSSASRHYESEHKDKDGHPYRCKKAKCTASFSNRQELDEHHYYDHD